MKKTFIIILASAGLLLLLLLSGITIPLGFLNPQIESTASRLLDRKVEIRGPVRLSTSLHPSIELQGLSVSHPRDWTDDGKLLDIERGRVQFSLWSLFSGEIQIDELEFEGVNVQLVTLADNSTNYQFTFPEEETDESATRYQLSSVGNLNLRKVQVEYLDKPGGQEYTLKIDEALGKGQQENPLQLSAAGEFSGKPYSIELTGDSFADLIRGNSAWSIAEGQLNIGSVVMDASGTLDRSGESMSGQFLVSIKGDDLNEVASMLDYPLPALGGFSLQSDINIKPDMLRFDRVELAALDSSVQGTISYIFGDERPVVKGTLSIPEIDTKLFSVFQEPEPGLSTPAVTAQARTQAGKEVGTQTATEAEDDDIPPIPWEMLKMLNTDIKLHVGQLKHNGLQAQDIKVAMVLADGDLSLPVSFIYDDVATTTKFAVETSDDIPRVAFSYDSNSIAIAPLLNAFGGNRKFSGQTGSVELDSRTRGNDMLQLFRNFTAKLKLAGSSLDTDAGRLFMAKTLSLDLRENGIFRLSGQGDFLERPFKITSMSEPAAGAKGAISYKVDLNACDTKLKLRATEYPPKENAYIDYTFSLNGRNLCSYLAPLAEYVGGKADFYSKGKGRLKKETGTLVVETLRLGDVVVDAKALLEVNNNGRPLLTVDIHSDSYDLTPLLSDRDESVTTNEVEVTTDDTKPTSQQQNTAVLDELLRQELLPELTFFQSANVNFHLDELNIGPGKVSNIRLSTKMRKGALADAPFQATIADELFTGDVRMDLSSQTPFVHIELSTNNFHLPVLFREFEIDSTPDLTADRIELLLEFKGKSLDEMLQHNSQLLTIKGGKWRVERAFGEALRIDIKQARYISRSNTPVKIDVSGHLDDQPLSIELTEDGFLSRHFSKPTTLEVHAKLADTELRMNGKVIRKSRFAAKESLLHTELSGSNMSSLNDLLGINLPPLGPYRIEGSLKLEEIKSSLNDMLLQIGDSVLRGAIEVNASLNDKGKVAFPLIVTTTLNAEKIQLDDFQFGNWSALTGNQDSGSETDEGVSKKENVKEEDGSKLKDLITPDVAKKFNGTLEVKVEEVLSGTDRLGSGVLGASLEKGLFSLDKLELDIPGGAVLMQGSLKPEENSIQTRLDIQVTQLDYGILARRAQPGSDLKGIFNLNLELNSEADTPANIKNNLNGRLQFGIIPEEYKSGAIDLWAVNILTAALPVMMKGNKAKVNCLAGDFTLVNGVMAPEVFMLDTSKIRVEGKGEVNLRTDTINFHLRPTPKSAHFFSAATPISITGNILDPHIGVSAGSVIATVFRMASSVIVAPLKKIFTRSLETDGKEACGAAMAWVKDSGE